MFLTFRESALRAFEQAEEALTQGREDEARVLVRWGLAICGAPTPFYEGVPDIAAARKLLEAFYPSDRTVYPTTEVGKAVVLDGADDIIALVLRMVEDNVCAVSSDGTTFYAVEL